MGGFSEERGNVPVEASGTGFRGVFEGRGEKQEKVLPLIPRPDGHTCPQCGQGTDLKMTLF